MSSVECSCWCVGGGEQLCKCIVCNVCSLGPLHLTPRTSTRETLHISDMDILHLAITAQSTTCNSMTGFSVCPAKGTILTCTFTGNKDSTLRETTESATLAMQCTTYLPASHQFLPPTPPSQPPTLPSPPSLNARACTMLTLCVFIGA